MGDQFTRPGSALGLLQGLYRTRFISLFGTLLDFCVFLAYRCACFMCSMIEKYHENVSNRTHKGVYYLSGNLVYGNSAKLHLQSTSIAPYRRNFAKFLFYKIGKKYIRNSNIKAYNANNLILYLISTFEFLHVTLHYFFVLCWTFHHNKR